MKVFVKNGADGLNELDDPKETDPIVFG